MKRIGILSDTHGFLDDSIFSHFNDCDEIWHAGDIGNTDISHRLSEFKPYKAVFGNIDDKSVRLKHPEWHLFEEENIRIVIIHIAGSIPRYTKEVQKLIEEHKPQILICGHSHILKVAPDKKNNLLYINPGAAGHHGFHKFRTILKMDLAAGQIKNMQAIELGKRGIN